MIKKKTRRKLTTFFQTIATSMMMLASSIGQKIAERKRAKKEMVLKPSADGEILEPMNAPHPNGKHPKMENLSSVYFQPIGRRRRPVEKIRKKIRKKRRYI